MSATTQPKTRRKLVVCALLLLGAFLAFRWFTSTNKTYLERHNFPAPQGGRDLIMIYKRNGFDISRLFFLRDAPPHQEPLIAMGRGNEPSLVVWSGDGTVVALANLADKGARWYYEGYDFQTHQHFADVDAPDASAQRNRDIAALLKNRGGAAAPAARQSHEIGADEQDKWRAIDPELH